MSVKLFYDPDRVEEFRRRGIDPRRVGAAEAAPARTPTARGALELVEENARLRAEVARLRADNQRLTDEVARLRGAPIRPDSGQAPLREDDAAARFALLELDL